MPRRSSAYTLPLFAKTALADVPLPDLRPYQAELIERLRKLVVPPHNRKRILVVGPCSMGKMVCIAAITRTSTLPTIFAAHRMELINQCVEQLGRFGLSHVGVLRGNDQRFDPSASIQVCSIDTLDRRDKPFEGKPVIIHIDEAHRAAADRYKRLLASYPDALVLGWTATPSRLDGEPLGSDDLFHHLELATTYEHLLKNPKWLVEPIIIGAPPRFDPKTIRVIEKKKGEKDYDEAELSRVMRRDEIIGDTLQHWLDWAHKHPVIDATGQRVPRAYQEGERRRTLFFAVNVDHSYAICDRYSKAGIRIAHIDGETPDTERGRVLRALEKGELDVVSNVNVFLEGIDCPPVKCVQHGRPTRSLVLWRQSTQRCMRPWNGIVPLILDHGQNMEEHGGPHEDFRWSLTEHARRMTAEPALKRCGQCSAFVTAGRITCSSCGFEFPPPEKRPAIGETDTRLVEYVTSPEAMRRAFYEKHVGIAKFNGYKPGFASAKHFEKYGVWPPREWGRQTKNLFSQDPDWIAAVAYREERKRKDQEEEAAKAAAKKEPPPDPDYLVGQEEGFGVQASGDEEFFDDWLREQRVT